MEALASMKVPDDGNPIPMPETADAIELPAATFLWLTARNAEFLSGRSVFLSSYRCLLLTRPQLCGGAVGPQRGSG